MSIAAASFSSQSRSPSTSRHVVVIGGGLGGLVAACVSAARRYRVTLLEKNDWVGGKAAVHECNGFRFDMGPTILTLPSVLKRVFAEADEKLEDYLTLVPLDPQWRCFFDKQSNISSDQATVLDLVSDTEEMKRRLTDFTGSSKSAEGYEAFMGLSEQLHGVSDRFFFWRSVGGLKDTMNVRTSFSAAVLRDVLSLRMGKSVASVVRQCVPDERVAQMMDHFTQYVGSSPYASPAVLCGIAHMQTQEGIWYPIGGTRAIPEALSRLARKLGVEIRTGQDVLRIETQSDQVTGVTITSGETLSCDCIISNCDAVRTYTELLANRATSAPRGISQREPACSGVVLYLGLRRRYEQLLHHNFIFSRDPHEEFDAIYHRGIPAPDPSAYVCAPAVTEPDVAPEGGEALYVLVHTPYLRPGHDWKRMLPEYREVILDKLERVAGMQRIRDEIVYENSLTPEDIHNRYRVLQGAIYGLASHGKFLGAFKPANRRSDVRGLYLAGGAAHPGPGMPMVMMSGWIAADVMDQDSRCDPRRVLKGST